MRRKPKPRKRNTKAADRRLRELIAISYADPSVLAGPHVQALAVIVDWVKTGALPIGAKPKLDVLAGGKTG